MISDSSRWANSIRREEFIEITDLGSLDKNKKRGESQYINKGINSEKVMNYIKDYL